MRVTQKGQVTIALEVRRALGIRPGSDVRFQLDGDGARLEVGSDDARSAVAAMRGAATSSSRPTRSSRSPDGEGRRVATHIPGTRLIAPA